MSVLKKSFWAPLKTMGSSGLFLILFTVIALIWANSPYAAVYQNLSKSWSFVINEGLMSFFLLLVGLEIKREMGRGGELHTFRKALLPIVAAFFGMLFPALIFLLINRHYPANYSAWAIPTATDIAFALGVMRLFGKKIPKNLFLLLAAIAIADDIGAVIIISVFYTQDLAFLYVFLSAICWVLLIFLNRCRLNNIGIYLLLGFFLWFFLSKSGIHASIAGVLLAFTIPLDHKPGERALLEKLERGLTYPVNYGVIPLFIILNAGIAFQNLGPISISGSFFLSMISKPIVLGVMLGLALGKPLGISLSIFVLNRLRWAVLPQGVLWREVVLMACLAGIGFTMAIFIADLAFSSDSMKDLAKAGILMGSILSILGGILSLFFWRK